MKLRKSVIITDLDNTLYDWVDIWHSSFNAMLQAIVEKTGISQKNLEKEFKVIHQKYGTSEYAFSLEELPSLLNDCPANQISQKYADCIKAFRDARDIKLRLYPAVLETLCKLKSKGCLIVCYTESMAFYSRYRLKKLGLDGIIDYLYSPKDHDVPKKLDKAKIDYYRKYDFIYTVPRHTPEGELKPNPHVLKDILDGIGISPDDAIYVGDNLIKDIVMAQEAGVVDVWAQYGVANDRKEYELLKNVTHWTKEDVEREKRITKEDVKPSYTLNRFDEILEMFDFVKLDGWQAFRVDEARIDQTIKIWEKTVDVQQHFNDLSLRIRNYVIAFLTATLGFSAFALKENYSITVFGVTTSLATFLILAALLPLLAFFLMDRFWYHKLLLGAVENGMKIEKQLKKTLPAITLTTEISKASPISISFRKWKIQIHSNGKFWGFYGLLAVFLILAAIVVFWGTKDLNKPGLSIWYPNKETKEQNKEVPSIEEIQKMAHEIIEAD